GVNIRALSLADTADFGILRLLVSDNDKAVSALKNNGFTVGLTEVLAIEVPDKPGGLAEFLKILGDNDINIEYLYAHRRGDNAIIIFRFDDLKGARNVIDGANIRIVEGEELYSM
ncbi:MAG: ACT domain-containing protein, partial [bacterium]